jgi:protein-S-isoprenylcysteine O-methyltransferase Ste14
MKPRAARVRCTRMVKRSPVVVQVGRVQLTRAALVALVVLIGLVALVMVRAPSRWPLVLSALGWVGFSVYWSAKATQSAEAKDTESAESRRVHLLLLNGGQLLLFLPIWGLRARFLPPSPLWVPLGLSIEGAGIALAVWARVHLAANWSGRIEVKASHQLIQTGPYRLLRHPIYTAVLALCVGTALVSGERHALAGVALVIIAYFRKIRLEEAKMREAFGTRYDDYRRRTLGMIPGLF